MTYLPCVFVSGVRSAWKWWKTVENMAWGGEGGVILLLQAVDGIHDVAIYSFITSLNLTSQHPFCVSLLLDTLRSW